MEAETAPKHHLNATAVNELETLLLLFPAAELKSFYDEFSQQMLLTTTTQVERHEALQELLRLLEAAQRQ